MPNEASAQGSAREEVYLHLTSDSSGKGKVTLINCHVMGLCKATEGLAWPPLECPTYLLRHDWRRRQGYLLFGTLPLTISRIFPLGTRGEGEAQRHTCREREKKKTPKRCLVSNRKYDQRMHLGSMWAQPHEQVSSQLERWRRRLPNPLITVKCAETKRITGTSDR
jgi:hypothetical protein